MNLVTDVRSDDEETEGEVEEKEGEVEEKEGEGVEVGISGGEKKKVEGVKENGVKPANGKATQPHYGVADGVVEGKKER